MPLRGEEQRAAIRAVLDVFGDFGKHLVFLGSCVLGVYARATGHALTSTKDVDCISTADGMALASLCSQLHAPDGPLIPDGELACRHLIRGTDYLVDVMDQDGKNVGATNRWFRRAAARAAAYEVGLGMRAQCVTPPYFLATKLVALADLQRASDLLSAKDLEDIATLAVEVPTLAELVSAEGISAEIAAEWRQVMAAHDARIADIPELVRSHLGTSDSEHRDLVVRTLSLLCGAP